MPKDICTLEGMSIMNIDSTNMTPDKWFVIANHIKEHYEQFDGFVITHETEYKTYYLHVWNITLCAGNSINITMFFIVFCILYT